MKVLVVDDEPLARERLLRILARIEDVSQVEEAGSGEAALARIAVLDPDVLLLDVEMPGLDGLALARTAGIPPIIFTTAHVHFAADAFEVDAVDFLTKPVRQERLERALEKLRRRVSVGPRSEATRLAVHDAGVTRFVDASSVAVFRARDKYTEFTLDGAEHLVRESLDALETRLGAGFARVHRAALLRLGAVAAIETDDGALVAKMRDGTRVEVSRRFAASLRRALAPAK